MATWVERYEVVPMLDEKRGPYYGVVQINSRGTRKLLHRYKGKDTADKIKDALKADVERELP